MSRGRDRIHLIRNSNYQVVANGKPVYSYYVLELAVPAALRAQRDGGEDVFIRNTKTGKVYDAEGFETEKPEGEF